MELPSAYPNHLNAPPPIVMPHLIALGINHHTTYYPRLPRPTPIADGEVIHGLFG